MTELFSTFFNSLIPQAPLSPLMQATIFLGMAILVVPFGQRLGLASVLGYLLCGIILGPHALSIVANGEPVMHFAEFGVVMLLFLIGLELQPSRLWALRRSIFVMGGMQVGVTSLMLMGLTKVGLHLPWLTCAIIGVGLSLSSTAFVLQLLGEKQQLDSTHGRKAFAILLFQDMAIIPLLAVLPLLSGTATTHYNWQYFLSLFLVFGGLIAASRFVMRPFFRFVALAGANELLTAVALFIVMGVALLMSTLHISMALGAFLTGVLLADSEYRHDLEASIEPFKGLLLGLFFMAVGMTANLSLLVSMPFVIIGGAVALMLLKFGVLAVIGRLAKQRLPTSVRLGISLAQGGEFAFVLFNTAQNLHVLTPSLTEPLILIVTLSMALTPLAFWLLDKYGEPRLQKLQPERGYDQIPDHGHSVMIIGFGRVGQIVGRILRMRQIEFTAIENSVRQVDFVRKFGNQIYYGQPANPELLRAAGIEKSRLVVLALDDVEESVRTAEMLHRHFPAIKVLARARDRQHSHRLREAGIMHVWRETLLSSLSMAETALLNLGMPSEQARHTIQVFKDYDERLLARQQAIFQDENKLIESARAAAIELEGLFDSDHLASLHQDELDKHTTLMPLDIAPPPKK